jgi:hypothetical protein
VTCHLATRIFGLSGLILSQTAAAPVAMPDVTAAGRAAATLSDWQTITYFLLILLAVATVERIVSAWLTNASRKAERQMTAQALERLADAMELKSNDLTVNLALIQDTLGRWERRQ